MTRTKCVVVTDIRTLANTPKSPEVSLDDFAYPPCVTPRYAELEAVLDGTAFIPERERGRCRSMSKGEYSAYRLVRKIVVPRLRSNERQRRNSSITALVGWVYKNKDVQSKKISRGKIREIIEMLLEDQILVIDMEATERYLGAPQIKKWVKLGPEATV